MKAIGVIPARWGSTRFEGKVLAEIKGRPMIEHVWQRAKQSQSLDDLLIACDDERIIRAAEQFGATAVMTSADHASGTDRITEAAESVDADIIVNIQGDEPMIEPAIIDDLVKALSEDKDAVMATVIRRFRNKDTLNDPNVVKVVVDGEMNALYFSRAPIPYQRDKDGETIFYKHVGIYAYRKEFLMSYHSLPKSNLEHAEMLEQLRALEYGYRIKVVVTDVDTIGVDTPEDIARIEAQWK